MKHTMNGFVHAKPNGYADEGDPDWVIEGFSLQVWTHADMSICGYTMVAPAVITFEIPKDWDPRAATVEVLRKRQKALQEEFSRRITEIEDEISKYLAIGA